MEVKKGDQNFSGLDGLRGILSIVVCLAHSWQTFIVPIEGNSTASGYVFGLSARFAVLSFFCLSGYVIALSVKKNIERFGEFSLAEYFSSRAFRILPSLFFVMALVYLIAEIATAYGVNALPDGMRSAREFYGTSVKLQLYCLATLCAKGDLTGVLNGPLWSLQYEIQLYTVTGLTSVVLFFRRHRFVRLIAIAALLIYLRFAFRLRSPSGDLNMQIVWFLLFAFGVCGFSLFNSVASGKLWGVAVSGMSICFALLAIFAPAKLLSNIDTADELIWAQIAFGIGCTAIIVLVSRLKVSVKLSNLGKFSYTLYIVHFPLLLILYFVLANSAPGYSLSAAWIVAAIGVVACILFAMAVSGIIENASAQRALVKKCIGILAVKYSRGVPK